MAETSFSQSPGNNGPSRGISRRPRICALLLVTTLVSIASKNVSAVGRFHPFTTTRTSTLSRHRILQQWHRHKHERLPLTLSLLQDVTRIPRGGSPTGVDVDDDEDDDEGDEVEETEVASNDEEKETAEEADEEDEDGDDEDEYDQEEEDEDEYDEEEEDDDEEEEADGKVEEATEIKYDEPFALSPMTSLYASVVVMLTCKKIDMFNPKVVRFARFVFISYIVVLQLFLLHVRVQAKKRNDRTAITLQNPLSSALRSQLESAGDGMKNGGGTGGGIITQLASSFLSSTSTVVEYDLKQALNMQGGVVFNMLFMWILHFKMEQVQPLFLQAATGLLNLCTCPLFQIYVLQRNLERPFKNPHVAARLEEAAKLRAEKEGIRTTPSDEDDSKDASEAEGQQADVSLESTSAEEEEEKDEGRVEGEPEEPVTEAEDDDDVEPTAEDTEEEDVVAASTDKEGAEGKGNEGDEAEGAEETDGQGDEAEDVLEDDEDAANDGD